MMKISHTLGTTSLFNGINDDELEAMLHCLGAREEAFAKNEYILRAGDSLDSVGLLLSGSALVIQEDFWGKRNILTKITPSGAFAEAFACSPKTVINVAVMAEDACSVLWLKVNRILTTCPTACTYHSRVVRNLLSEIASKNILLNTRMTHMGQRTTRDKILSYLSWQAQNNGRSEFDIVFNRQQLADYLSVERSALSAELSKLRNDGVLEFDKNHFLLKHV